MTLVGLIVLYAGGFCLFWFDKAQARQHGWRISERALLLACVVGGFGAWLGQQTLRHKTRKEPFRTWMSVALILHAIGVCAVVWRLLP